MEDSLKHRLETAEARIEAQNMALVLLMEHIAITDPLRAKKLIARFAALGADAMPAAETKAYEWVKAALEIPVSAAVARWRQALARPSVEPRD